jgi:hypothetical protein
MTYYEMRDIRYQITNNEGSFKKGGQQPFFDSHKHSFFEVLNKSLHNIHYQTFCRGRLRIPASKTSKMRA